VHATGQGEATGMPLASGLSALDDERAVADLPAEARELLALARCPKCRTRGPRAIRGWWLVETVQVAFVLAVFAGVPTLVFRFAFGMQTTSSELSLCFVALPYVAIRFVLRLRQVDRRVLFEA
jgi:hypothetical protein